MEECQMSDISFQVLEQARYADGGAELVAALIDAVEVPLLLLLTLLTAELVSVNVMFCAEPTW